LESAQVVRELAPDIGLARMDRSGVIVTAPGDGNYDFVSRLLRSGQGIPKIP